MNTTTETKKEITQELIDHTFRQMFHDNRLAGHEEIIVEYWKSITKKNAKTI